MIVITGSKGFIGGALSRKIGDAFLVDTYFYSVFPKIDLQDFIDWWFDDHYKRIDFVVHLGAVTNTLETNEELFEKMNVEYSRSVWKLCIKYKIPLIYASSAATYGMGENGYSDNHDLIENLEPLNKYGESKHEFDKFVLAQMKTPPYWYGLKFFNVYGFDESHKGEMASMIYKCYSQSKRDGRMKLFTDGQQARDFIYVEDVIKVIMWVMENKPPSGIYNVGTGHARTFNDMAEIVSGEVEYFDIPHHIEKQYQKFTEADISKLRGAGYDKEFYSLEDGISDYIKKLS